MAKSTIIQPDNPINTLSLTSKWAFFSLSEGGVGGTETGVLASNDSRATTLVDHDLSTATAVWAAKDGWWTGSGTEYIEGLTNDDATAMEEVFNIGTNSALCWIQLNGVFATGQRLFSFGQNAGSPAFTLRGVECEISAGAAKFWASDTDDTRVGSVTPSVVNDSSDYFVCGLINRTTNELTAYTDGGTPGQLAPDASPADLSSSGDLGGGTISANKRLLIGAGLNGSNARFQFANGSVRRFGWINFGSIAVPSNINDIMTDLSYSRGIPVRSMQGI